MKPFQETLDRTRQRLAELNPEDRRTRLDLFAFVFPGQEASASPALVPLGNGALPQAIMLSPFALGQLLEKVGYPKKLLEALPGKAVQFDVNWLLQHGLEDRMSLIRVVKGNTARAILGSRYTPLDDFQLLEAAAPYLEGAVVRYEGFGELSTHITVTWPAEQEGGLERGLHLANSEVGVRAITIEAVAWRVVCGNVLPAIGGNGDDSFYESGGRYFRRVRAGAHDLTGGREGTVKAGWRFIHTGDPQRLVAFVQDAIADTKRQYDTLLARWRGALQAQLPDPLGAMEGMVREGDLTSDQFKRLLEAWAEEKSEFGNSVAGVTNAFTRAAQAEIDPEERYRLQALGTASLRTLPAGVR